ncbi:MULTISPECIES: ABC transporter permease [unclassified Caballeronia]|jgi:ribose transport system permease protein|uniref:ABC transporter permease n=1 Tax=unclassified Caballeronia TaxID=2646786 RepID=UPI003ECEA2EB
MLNLRDESGKAGTGFVRGEDKRGAVRLQRETVSAIGVYAVCVLALFLSKFINPEFGSIRQLQTILTLASFLIVVSYGQGLTVLIGGLDLSIPSVITVGGVLAAAWMSTLSPAEFWWQIPAVLVACSLVGVVNGLGVTLLRIPPFIMTLASGIIVYSICLGATGGTPSGAAPNSLSTLMAGRVGGVPSVNIFVVIFCVIAVFMQSRTSFGQRLYAMGSNPVAAKIAGMRINVITVITYALSSALAGFAGMMLVGYSNGATLRMGDSYLLPSIAAVVIGGSSILGGRGTFLGTIGGAILLTIFDMVITSLGLAQGWRTMISGGLILAAILLQHEGALDWIRSMGRRRQ